MTKHEVDVAFVDWRALSGGERAKVVRSARKGRFHPDTNVAETSVRWAFATQVRSPPSRRDRLRADRGATGLGLVIALVIGFFSEIAGIIFGGGAAAALSDGMFERKTAQRLRRMADSRPR